MSMANEKTMRRFVEKVIKKERPDGILREHAGLEQCQHPL